MSQSPLGVLFTVLSMCTTTFLLAAWYSDSCASVGCSTEVYTLHQLTA